MRNNISLPVKMLCAGAVLAATAACRAGEKVYVGTPCRTADKPSLEQVDHSRYHQLLRRYVDEHGMVAYQEWKQNQADIRELETYLTTAACVDLDRAAPRAGRLAYWINLYNALTIRGILREYPTTSIRNHTARVWGYNIWHDLLLRIDGREFSLEDIEQRVLRPLKEPRIHFAIVCAAKGCPRLLNEAYTAEKLDEQLDRNARHFFAHPLKFRVEFRSRTVYLSSILKWFAEDFGSTQTAVLNRIRPYLPAHARGLVGKSGVSVEYLDYDWSLNERSS